VRFLFYLIFSFLIISCGDSDFVPTSASVINKSQTPENLNKFYGPNMRHLYVRVYYEAGAEPYAGKNNRDQPLWGLLEENLKKIFEVRTQNTQVNIPKELNEMNLVTAQGKDSWTPGEIVEFAQTLGVPPTDEASSFFTILFLKGAYNSGEQISNSVLGVSITGTTIIAIFKDAIRQLGPSDESLVVKFGEQATLVHEMGHALGIVANGVSAVTEHHDQAHGAHCSNSDCVMYWMNEGNQDLLQFIQGLVTEGNKTLYGPQCLDDIKAYSP
jgi:hypothetical protein